MHRRTPLRAATLVAALPLARTIMDFSQGKGAK